MGRGRQKAKQVKIARDLKYYSPPTDLTALQRELSSANAASADSRASTWDEDEDLYEDKWATEDEDDWEEEPGSSR